MVSLLGVLGVRTWDVDVSSLPLVDLEDETGCCGTRNWGGRREDHQAGDDRKGIHDAVQGCTVCEDIIV